MRLSQLLLHRPVPAGSGKGDHSCLFTFWSVWRCMVQTPPRGAGGPAHQAGSDFALSGFASVAEFPFLGPFLGPCELPLVKAAWLGWPSALHGHLPQAMPSEHLGPGRALLSLLSSSPPQTLIPNKYLVLQPSLSISFPRTQPAAQRGWDPAVHTQPGPVGPANIYDFVTESTAIHGLTLPDEQPSKLSFSWLIFNVTAWRSENMVFVTRILRNLSQTLCDPCVLNCASVLCVLERIFIVCFLGASCPVSLYACLFIRSS